MAASNALFRAAVTFSTKGQQTASGAAAFYRTAFPCCLAEVLRNLEARIEMEGAALVGLTLKPQTATHQGNQAVGKREPHAQATVFARQ
jgi:hypothetical protein